MPPHPPVTHPLPPRQVYLGGYDLEEAAAEAYDMAVLKTKGPGVATNVRALTPTRPRPLSLDGPLPRAARAL